MDKEFTRHVLLYSDAKGYSDRKDVEQHRLQQELVDVLANAAEAADLDRARWAVQSTGDGELSVLPNDVADWTVIDRFPAALANVLSMVNEGREPEDRLRMRLAIHNGLVQRAAGGYAGNGVVTAARMVDCDTARHALRACPATDLVVLLSSSLYNEVVVQRHTTLLSIADFREVVVSNKTFQESAWLHIPGYDVHKLQLDESVARERRAKSVSPAIPAAVVNHIGEARAKNISFGIQNNFG